MKHAKLRLKQKVKARYECTKNIAEALAERERLVML